MTFFNMLSQTSIEMRPAQAKRAPVRHVYHLDTANECLWRKNQKIDLDPKAFAVLRYLVENPGRIVTKAELLNTVWSGNYVGESVIKFQISRIRAKLREAKKIPRFIETVHCRGYRFVGQLRTQG